MIRGRHYLADEITADTVGVKRAVLLSDNIGYKFDLMQFSKSFFPSIKKCEIACDLMVKFLNKLVPNVENWWENDEANKNFVYRNAEFAPKTEFVSVKGKQKRVWMVQKIFAWNKIWDILFLFITFFVTAMVFIPSIFFAPLEQSFSWLFCMFFIGIIAGLIVSYFILLILDYFIMLINGGPFNKGDVVQVISGIHAGKIGKVYELWPSRGQIMVGSWRRSIQELF